VKQPVIAVLDYDMGNLRSVAKALERAGAKAVVTANARQIKSADALVFPGVGAFIPALKNLTETGLIDAIRESIAMEKPFLGLCLGFQLLFDHSTEGGRRKGLSVINGGVERFSFAGKNKNLKIPHMGWNQVAIRSKQAASTMFNGIANNAYFYFVHSYYGQPSKKADVAATTDYGGDFCSAIIQGKVWGCQFHPEKSGPTGIKLLKNFIKEVQ
jgi:glutamine amidotransferase